MSTIEPSVSELSSYEEIPQTLWSTSSHTLHGDVEFRHVPGLRGRFVAWKRIRDASGEEMGQICTILLVGKSLIHVSKETMQADWKPVPRSDA